MKLSPPCAFLAIVLLLMTSVGIIPAMAVNEYQGRTITVTVTDSMGPVPGANVVVIGETIGGSTNADGVIVLSKVPADAVLEVSFVGYVTKKVTVGNKSKIAVFIEEDKQAIDEAVVVAYGHQKKVPSRPSPTKNSSKPRSPTSVTHSPAAWQVLRPSRTAASPVPTP